MNMTRYKGRQNAKAVERDFPHFVDIIVPPGGLGLKLDAMYDFHTQHGIKHSAVMGGMMLTVVLSGGASQIWL